MKEKIEEHLSGSTDKPKINKTGFYFLKKWLDSLLNVRNIVLLIISLFGAKYALDFFVIKLQLPALPQNIFGFIFLPLVAVALIITIVRTIKLAITLLSPNIKAEDFIIDDSTIIFSRPGGQKDTYTLNEIHNFILTYNFKGVLVRTSKGVMTYSLKLDPKEIEMKLDVLSNFHKQFTSIQSREGYVRTVWFGNPLFVAENKSFNAANKNLENGSPL